jgi:hypothetical protein
MVGHVRGSLASRSERYAMTLALAALGIHSGIVPRGFEPKTA